MVVLQQLDLSPSVVGDLGVDELPGLMAVRNRAVATRAGNSVDPSARVRTELDGLVRDEDHRECQTGRTWPRDGDGRIALREVRRNEQVGAGLPEEQQLSRRIAVVNLEVERGLTQVRGVWIHRVTDGHVVRLHQPLVAALATHPEEGRERLLRSAQAQTHVPGHTRGAVTARPVTNPLNADRV